MIGLNYTSLALWLGMGPAFPECGQKRSWVLKQNQDSVRRKEGESDCYVDNYDCDSLFSKLFSLFTFSSIPPHSPSTPRRYLKCYLLGLEISTLPNKDHLLYT